MPTEAEIQKLDIAFYRRSNVLAVAKDLLGKLIITGFDPGPTIGRIVETEAYEGVTDKASHAYGGRYTNRTKIMYHAGGVAYVYLCYGIHHLFNVVSAGENEPHAILIRGIAPVAGIEIMMHRLRKTKPDFSIGRGPGNVAKALGINRHHSGISLLEPPLYLGTDAESFSKKQIIASPRIGVDYAGEDALLPYRFYIHENPYVSGKRNSTV